MHACLRACVSMQSKKHEGEGDGEGGGEARATVVGPPGCQCKACDSRLLAPARYRDEVASLASGLPLFDQPQTSEF